MADALPLIAYPDLESRVKAVEEDGFVYFPRRSQRGGDC